MPRGHGERILTLVALLKAPQQLGLLDGEAYDRLLQVRARRAGKAGERQLQQFWLVGMSTVRRRRRLRRSWVARRGRPGRSGFVDGTNCPLPLLVVGGRPGRQQAQAVLGGGAGFGAVGEVRSSSATSAMASKVRWRVPMAGWWRCLTPVVWRRTSWRAQRARKSVLRVDSSPIRAVRSWSKGSGRRGRAAGPRRRPRRGPSCPRRRGSGRRGR